MLTTLPEPAATTTASPAVDDVHVALRDVRLAYGQERRRTLAVDGLTLELQRGEFAAVVGPSGCGKSTLMKLVTGLLQPTAGSVRVDGALVHGPIKAVGMAFQNATLLPWRTTLRNVMLPLEVVEPHKSRLRTERAAYVARVERLLHSVGLGEFAGGYPWELSGGMQQRANLARALVHEPRLLMLDEPFAALDAFTREELWSVMQTLWLAHRFSAILVTHELREAVFLADTVHVMSARPGRIVLSRSVDLPRPRTLAMTYEPGFVMLVRELHDAVGADRPA